MTKLVRDRPRTRACPTGSARPQTPGRWTFLLGHEGSDAYHREQPILPFYGRRVQSGWAPRRSHHSSFLRDRVARSARREVPTEGVADDVGVGAPFAIGSLAQCLAQLRVEPHTLYGRSCRPHGWAPAPTPDDLANIESLLGPGCQFVEELVGDRLATTRSSGTSLSQSFTSRQQPLVLGAHRHRHG